LGRNLASANRASLGSVNKRGGLNGFSWSLGGGGSRHPWPLVRGELKTTASEFAPVHDAEDTSTQAAAPAAKRSCEAWRSTMMERWVTEGSRRPRTIARGFDARLSFVAGIRATNPWAIFTKTGCWMPV